MTSPLNYFYGLPSSSAAAGGGQGDSEPLLLPENFEPSETDVICQRGKESFEHSGNKRFRALVEKNLEQYLQATSRREKSRIVSKIFDSIRYGAKRPSEGFIRKDLLTRRWYLVDDKEARDKVGQALRDAIKTYRAQKSASKTGDKAAGKNVSNEKRGKKRQAPGSEGERIPINSNLDPVLGTNSLLMQHMMMPGNNPGAQMAGYPMVATPPLPFASGRHEDTATFLQQQQQQGLSPNSMLESSIAPLESGDDASKRGRHQQQQSPCDREIMKPMPGLPALALQDNFSSQASNMQTPSDWFLRMSSAAAPAPSSSMAFSMLLQGNNAVEQARRQLMGGGTPFEMLEPTPLQFQQAAANNPSVDPRTAALAQLLFNEGGSTKQSEGK